LSQSDVDPLVTKELHQLAPMRATLPISPEDGVGRKRHVGWFIELGGRALWMQHRDFHAVVS